jgi:DNA-binding response OmpR family regulator
MEHNGWKGLILIAEDDRNTAALVATYLQREGFATLMTGDGESAMEMARRHNPLLLVLDLMLPKVDGWEVCRALRRESDIPILMLTAREEEIDRILGLSMGADDYVVKPFSPRELVERVKAILRRARPVLRDEEKSISVGPLVLDPVKRSVTRHGNQLCLTAAEFRLLHALMESPGRTYTRDELLGRLYGHGEAVVDRVIDVHIGNLRQKIEEVPARPRLILTVRGFGYRFVEAEEAVEGP